MDYLVTVPGHLAVYGNDGRKLWIARADIAVGGQSESQGLPGHHGPGVAAGDVDGDGKCEVVFLTKDSVLHVVEGDTGEEKARAAPPVPEGAERWEVAMIADFRGTGGDGDLLLPKRCDPTHRLVAVHAQLAYDHRHLRRAQIPPHVADQMRKLLRVLRIAPADAVVPALEPDQAGDLKPPPRIILREVLPHVIERLPDLREHFVGFGIIRCFVAGQDKLAIVVFLHEFVRHDHAHRIF